MARTKARSWRQLRPPEQERLIALLGEGVEVEDVARAMNCSRKTVWRTHRDWQLRRRRVSDGDHRLRFAEREEISRGIVSGQSFRAIGRSLGRAPSTVSREVGGAGAALATEP